MEKYSTFWPRFLAGFVDGLVLSPISLLDGYLTSPVRSVPVLVCWAIFSYSAYSIYSVTMHARYGQTVGKMAAKVRVLNVNEDRLPTVRQAILRDIGTIYCAALGLGYTLYQIATHSYTAKAGFSHTFLIVVGTINIGWFLLEFATMVTNEKRRAFHDLLAGTVVVREGYYALESGLRLRSSMGTSSEPPNALG